MGQTELFAFSESDAALVEVLPLSGFGRALTYRAGARKIPLAPGMLVEIPLRRGTEQGIVRALGAKPPEGDFKLRTVGACVHPFPVLTPPLLALAEWMSRYYLAPLETVFETMIPAPVRKGVAEAVVRFVETGAPLDADARAALARRAPKQFSILEFLEKRGACVPRAQVLETLGVSPSALDALVEKGAVRQFEKSRMRDAYADALSRGELVDAKPFELNAEQRAAFDDVFRSLRAGGFKTHLIHGVTGSGKTEIYLRAIHEALAAGGSVIYLVPEVALTPQTVGRLRARLADSGTDVVVWHSMLSAGERVDAWRALACGTARVVVGARSAVFAPLKNVRLIVVDEEHEPAYKQDETPRYHGRDTAVYRALLEKAVCVLGSATPSFESMRNARAGRYALNTLAHRVDNRTLPLVELVDMRHETFKAFGGVLSRVLADKIRARLDAHEQVILFLNRRGYFSSLLCPECGYVGMCPHCSIPLTYHRTDHTLRCHLCGYQSEAPRECPECKSAKIRWRGFGTQRIEEAVQNAFPRARVLRLDADTMSRKNRFREVLGDFRAGKIDILVGTQMIAKGLDFPNVTLVGLLAADLSLHREDFRAPERTFQLLVQVAGRAGRGERAGEVVVQTYTPSEPPIQFAKRAEYDAFFDYEMPSRAKRRYPPYRHLIRQVLRGRSLERCEFAAKRWAEFLETRLDASVEMRGPAPAPLEMAKDFYRLHFWFFCDNALKTADRLAALRAQFPLPPDVQDAFDVDPVDLM